MSTLLGNVALWLYFFIAIAGFIYAGITAYQIRLFAVQDYGKVIHEFDPWFNYRSTEYLAEHGWSAFFSWFDERSWYPLGRPVGTTIYPGMQIAAVGLWKAFNFLGYEISLNDVCVFIPAWFGVIATTLTGMISYECTGSWSAGAVTALIMAIIPAHIMRSVAGGFDNESVAMTTMTLTFYFWVRSLRGKENTKVLNSVGTEVDPVKKVSDFDNPTTDSYIFGTLCGLAYITMVAAWGGYIFVLNLIGAHAGILVLLGRYNSSLHRAYSLFFVIGTAGAVRVPVVGWTPFRSLEQIGPLLVFLGFQVLELIEIKRQKELLNIFQVAKLRIKYGAILGICLLVVAASLFQHGFFSPFSARVRALFVQHTRTGNPLVDSVAEHQPANENSYRQYLSAIYPLAQIGGLVSAFNYFVTYSLPMVGDKDLASGPLFNKKPRQVGSSFLFVYALIAFFFANKMSRLILLLGPIASQLAGLIIGMALDELVVIPSVKMMEDKEPSLKDTNTVEAKETKQKSSAKKKKNKRQRRNSGNLKKEGDSTNPVLKTVKSFYLRCVNLWGSQAVLVLRAAMGTYLVYYVLKVRYGEFSEYSHVMAKRMSHPSIMFKAQLNNGQNIIVDDYREAYWWLRDNTPEDSRILSWWDYGYQIAGIANRTTLADGNTWNHEHIATIGRILTAPPKEAHKLARHLADYVLLWTGGGGDDCIFYWPSHLTWLELVTVYTQGSVQMILPAPTLAFILGNL
eukprot:maker-scaffold_14-snap-gene-6.51-mRNA-1 protein AED:0.04 eAED:0.04 QI:0/0.33/0.42/1/0.66/0.57/7/762/737